MNQIISFIFLFLLLKIATQSDHLSIDFIFTFCERKAKLVAKCILFRFLHSRLAIVDDFAYVFSVYVSFLVKSETLRPK